MVKIIMEDITPFYGIVIRFVLAFTVFIIFCGRHFIREIKREYLLPGVIISLCTALAFVASYFALMNTTSTTAGFLMGLSVLFTPFLARFFLGARLNPILIFPIAFVILGMYYLCGASGAFVLGVGELCALLSSAAAACMIVASAKYLTDDIDPLVISVIQTGMVAIYCIPFALLLEEVPVWRTIPMSCWLAILYFAVACSCIAYIIQNLAFSKVPSVYAALIFCSEPIFTAIASYFMLGEVLNNRGLFGSALIMVSITIASIIPNEYDHRSRPLRMGRIQFKKALRYVKKKRA